MTELSKTYEPKNVETKWYQVWEKGGYFKANHFQAYLEHLLSYVDVSKLKPLKVVINAGNGAAGPVMDGLENLLPLELFQEHFDPMNKPDIL